MASASTGQAAAPAAAGGTSVCFIHSFDGHYLSAIDGGGRVTDVIETNRTRPSTWETFTWSPPATAPFPSITASGPPTGTG